MHYLLTTFYPDNVDLFVGNRSGGWNNLQHSYDTKNLVLLTVSMGSNLVMPAYLGKHKSIKWLHSDHLLGGAHTNEL